MRRILRVGYEITEAREDLSSIIDTKYDKRTRVQKNNEDKMSRNNNCFTQNDSVSCQGLVFSKKIEFHVEILKMEKFITAGLVKDFKEWITNKAVELGLGTHAEYYCSTGDVKNDVLVVFKCVARELKEVG